MNHGWTIKRGGLAFAEAVPDSPSSTMQALARKIRMDETEIDTWLLIESDESESGQRSLGSFASGKVGASRAEPKRNSLVSEPVSALGQQLRFLVPNHLGIYTARRKWYDISLAAARCRVRVRNMARTFESAGFKVTRRLNSNELAEFTSLWNLEGISIVLAGGHGNRKGFVYDAIRGDIVTPHDVRPPYKLAAVEVHSCFATSDFANDRVLPTPERTCRWIDHVSKYGSFTGGAGYLWLWKSLTTLEQDSP